MHICQRGLTARNETCAAITDSCIYSGQLSLKLLSESAEINQDDPCEHAYEAHYHQG